MSTSQRSAVAMPAFQPTMPTAMPALQKALDAQSYDWLAENYSTILTAVEHEIANGRTPGEIKRFVLRWTGRMEFALRCESAARHVDSMAV